MNEGPSAPLKELAESVTEVGVLLRRWRRDAAARQGVWEGGQFKAAADRMAHTALRDRLARLDRSVPVLSEEDPDSLTGPRPRRYWLIDPIDGTASYAHGYPGYVTQAALMAEEQPVLAAVHAPEADVCYTAERGIGAWANGRPLPRLAAVPPGSGVLIDNTAEPRGLARSAYRRFGYTRYRECGSIALKLCAVAEGSAHLFLKDVPVRDWDVAAPHLLLDQTGGALLRLDGSPFGYRGGFEHSGLIAASAPRTAAEVLRRLRGASPPPPEEDTGTVR